ncbi:MAG: chorismate-binding protein [Maribacter sp.]|uniref:chorismate-binding protein n=1 Tax=Maribacter sp. TaxID=1897614 RepID=UPI003C770566
MVLEVLRKVEAHLASELPFVLYRKPRSKVLQAILQKDDQLHFTHDFSEEGFVFAPFDPHGPVVLLSLQERLEAAIEETIKPGLRPLTQPVEHTDDKERHLKLVEESVRQIGQGHLDKVVISRKLEVGCSSPPLVLFQRLVANYDSALCYLWYHPKVGMWLGATPEILLRTANNKLTTMSLAGTRAFIEGEPPLWGRKELKEQQMVTDYIANALRQEVTHMTIGDVESVRAGQLWHLRTRITAVFNKNLPNIIRALHPTPAVCGLPLQTAQKFILEHEPYNREYYTGFLGELNIRQETFRAKGERNQENKSYRSLRKATELYVNLRCMKLVDDKATLFVGGGITKDSVPEDEWQETIEKSTTMLRVLLP